MAQWIASYNQYLQWVRSVVRPPLVRVESGGRMADCLSAGCVPVIYFSSYVRFMTSATLNSHFSKRVISQMSHVFLLLHSSFTCFFGLEYQQ